MGHTKFWELMGSITTLCEKTKCETQANAFKKLPVQSNFKSSTYNLPLCADHYNENKDLYCFSQSNSFACIKECGKELEKQQIKQKRPSFDKGDFPQNLFCFHCNFCLRNGTHLGNDSNYR